MKKTANTNTILNTAFFLSTFVTFSTMKIATIIFHKKARRIMSLPKKGMKPNIDNQLSIEANAIGLKSITGSMEIFNI